jgi:hypothetical protein
MEGADTLRIVNQSLHVFDHCGECKRSDAAGLTVIGDHVLATRWAVLEYEHLLAALSAYIEQLVASAPQKAGEIEISGLERTSTDHALVPCAAGAGFLKN